MKLLLPALVIALASPQAAPSDVLLLKGDLCGRLRLDLCLLLRQLVR